jgi:hypothetical protein
LFRFFLLLFNSTCFSLSLSTFRSRRNNNKTNDQSPFSLLFSRLREARGTVFIFFQGEGKEGILKLKTSASYSSLSPLSLWLDLTTHLCRNATTRALYFFFLYSTVLELHCVAESEKKKRKNGNEPNKETKRKEEEEEEEEEGKGLLDEASVVFFLFF